MNFNPKVSIIIPVYNGANYLRDAIDAALGQTYSNIEVIVINDGSTDKGKTEEIAHSFGERIRYFTKGNGGVATALNLGIGKMTGEYFSWLSHDDLYFPDKIEQQILALSNLENWESIILYGNYDVEYVDTGKTMTICLHRTDPMCFRYQLVSDNKIHGCTLLIPRGAFRTCGLFNEELRATQDYDMWFRLAASYTFVHIPKSMVVGRVHGEQVGVRMHAKVVEENIAFCRKGVDELAEDELRAATGRNISISLICLVEIFIKRGFYGVAGRALVLSARSLARDGVSNALVWPAYLLKSLVGGICLNLYSKRRRLVSMLRSLPFEKFAKRGIK